VEVSALRKHFDLLILGIYAVFTVWITECLMKLICDVLVIQGRMILIICSIIIIVQSQQLLLEFIDFDMHSTAIQRIVKINLKDHQIMIKQSISLISLIYLLLRIVQQFDIHVPSMVHRHLQGTPLTLDQEGQTPEQILIRYFQMSDALSCLSIRNLSLLIPLLYGQVRLTNFGFRYSITVRRIRDRDLAEAKKYEKIWQKALSNSNSDGILLCDLIGKKLSLNQKIKDLLVDC